jgi:hypothetical protein
MLFFSKVTLNTSMMAPSTRLYIHHVPTKKKKKKKAEHHFSQT